MAVVRDLASIAAVDRSLVLAAAGPSPCGLCSQADASDRSELRLELAIALWAAKFWGVFGELVSRLTEDQFKEVAHRHHARAAGCQVGGCRWASASGCESSQFPAR